jgi:hypothetical protein
VRALGIVTLLAVAPLVSDAQTPAEAFQQGQSMGASGSAAIGREIESGTSTATVPNYSDAQPQSSLFAGGSGSLVPPGAAQVSGCQVNPADPDPLKRQQCDATNFLAKKSTTASFNLPPTDPVLKAAKPITGNPESILGSMSGTYSACTPQTVTAPARKQIEVCAETRAPEERSCEKVLTVTVTTSQSCVPGTWFAGGSADRNNVDHMTGYVYCDPGRGPERHLVQVYAYGANGACTGPIALEIDQTRPGTPFSAGTLQPHWENACRPTPAQVIAGGCSGKTCSARFDFAQLVRTFDPKTRTFVFVPTWLWSFWVSYQLPEVFVTEADSWNNQCSAYEARL